MESQSNVQTAQSTRAIPSTPAHTYLSNDPRPSQFDPQNRSRMLMAPNESNLEPLEHSDSAHGSSVADPVSREDADGRVWQDYRPDKYFLPNDATEQDRLNLFHQGFCMQLHLLQDPTVRSQKVEDALVLAPINGDPPRVLDLGTGTGVWAIEFARCHPDSQVIGADLSLIQPDVSASVPNVSFVRADAEEEWAYDAPFDLVHARLMFSCYINHRDVIKRVFDNLNPGGWIEYQDNSFSIDSDDNTHRGTGLHIWGHLAQAGAAAKGRDFEAARKFKDYFAEAGFVDVVETRCKTIGSPWSTTEPERSLGRCMLDSSYEVVKNVSGRLLGEGGLGLPQDKIQPIVAQALKDVKDPNVHFYWPGFIVYGRKPFTQETAAVQTDR